MRVMVLVKATPNSDAETLFREPGKLAKRFAGMGGYHEELVAGCWIREVKSMKRRISAGASRPKSRRAKPICAGGSATYDAAAPANAS